MKNLIWAVIVLAGSALGGVYYMQDVAGNVSRHTGDTPYPTNAVWRSEVTADTPVSQLTITNGVVRMKSIEQLEAQRIAAIQAELTPSVVQAIQSFLAILHLHFGEGAETNTAITADAVTGYFLARRLTGTGANTDAEDAMILQTGFELIKGFAGDGTIWSFPWQLLPEE